MHKSASVRGTLWKVDIWFKKKRRRGSFKIVKVFAEPADVWFILSTSGLQHIQSILLHFSFLAVHCSSRSTKLCTCSFRQHSSIAPNTRHLKVLRIFLGTFIVKILPFLFLLVNSTLVQNNNFLSPFAAGSPSFSGRGTESYHFHCSGPWGGHPVLNSFIVSFIV